MTDQHADVVVVGGGIVGLATAVRLGEARPGARVVVLDKEPAVGRHQTGHNSGVLHTGLYYKPGSLKATLCRTGKTAMEAFCAAEDIPFERTGKVVVATSDAELPALDRIEERGRANGVTLTRVGVERLAELEPHARGVAALHVPDAGLYYKPGSLKATLCRTGKTAMEAFCAAEDIPFERTGKVVVATSDAELPALDRIEERGRANGVTLTRVGVERLAELEPHARGVAALHVPDAGIVDYKAVVRRFAERVEERGGSVVTGAKALRVVETGGGITVETTAGAFAGTQAVACAGLQSDRLARASGADPGVQIVPFRGEYFELVPSAEHLCRTLIYPVPDPAFPFLGVHFTRMIGGGVECGPNAVLAFAREGYTRTTVNLRDLAETLGYSGFRRLARKHLRAGLGEMWRSFSKAAFVRALQRLVPEIRAEHLVPAEAGVRAQAVRPDGALEDDFALVRRGRVLHVVNAPSPAATASLAIGQHIADALGH